MRQRMTLVLGVMLMPGMLVVPGRSGRGAEPLPDSRLGVRTAPLLLLSRRDVQADLGMSREQVTEADRAIATLHARAVQVRGMTGETAVAARRAIDEEQQRWIETHLSEEQRVRVVQVDLQWEGASALISRPSMSDSLGLNPQQLATLKQLAQDARGRRARGEAAMETHRRFAGQALEVLSDTQRESWKAMLGKPFHPQLGQADGQPPAPTRPR